MFSTNYCAGSGGAIALLGNVYITPGPLVFEENESGTSGGAMFISGTVKGPIFSNTKFVTNIVSRCSVALSLLFSN